MDRLITIKQAAALSGLSARQVYKLIASGRFGPEIVRINRSARIRESELLRWFEEGCPDRETFEHQLAAGVSG